MPTHYSILKTKGTIMSAMAYAFLKAQGYNPSKMADTQIQDAMSKTKKELSNRKFTGNKKKDAILTQLYKLGAKPVVSPAVLSTKELMWELRRALKTRNVSTQKAAFIISRAEQIKPRKSIDKLWFAMFGLF
jgi:hypothetical protein